MPNPWRCTRWFCVELQGEMLYIGKPFYRAHGATPITRQSHGDPSEPIGFRNIWLRELE